MRNFTLGQFGLRRSIFRLLPYPPEPAVAAPGNRSLFRPPHHHARDGPVDLVIIVNPGNIAGGRDFGNIQPVNFGKFASFGQKAGHDGKLVVHPEQF